MKSKSNLCAEDCPNSKANQTLPLNSSTFMIPFFGSPIDSAIFKKKINLFIWLHWILVEAQGIFVAMCRLSSCDMQPPEIVDSVVVAHKLICPVACGILVPQPGIRLMSHTVEGIFLTTGLPGKFQTLQSQARLLRFPSNLLPSLLQIR